MDVEIDECLDKARKWSGTVDGVFSELLDSKLSHVHVQKRFRLKSRASLIRKIQEKLKEKPYGVRHVTDVVGFRFVCHFSKEVQQVVEVLLEKMTPPQNVEFGSLEEARIYASRAPNQKDLVDGLQNIFTKFGKEVTIEEKLSRYTSVHMVVKRSENQKYEIQIRNVFEDAWAEIEHALKYKAGQGRDLHPTVTRHLQVLNTFIQACSEYSENILTDSVGESGNATPSVDALNDDAEELERLPQSVRILFDQAVALRKSGNITSAIEALSKFLKDNQKITSEDRLSKYYLLMERGLCFLTLGKTQAALEDYEDLKAENPNRALLYYRLADVYRIESDFIKTAEYLELIQGKLASPENTREELMFLRKVPFIKAHAYWRIKEPELSVKTLESLKRTDPEYVKDNELKYINSRIYYLLEAAKKQNKEVPPTKLRTYYRQLSSRKVKDGNHWEELDTLCRVCMDLHLVEEAVECATKLESMIDYVEEGKPPIIRLGNNVTIIAPLEETEIVRNRINAAKKMSKDKQK